MQDTSNVGSAEHAGLQRTPLHRLRPFEIATLLLPGTNVQVMDASDAQFQAFLLTQNLSMDDGEIDEWSFDDRVRLINHWRKYGRDLFAEPNKKSSDTQQKQFTNNSESIPCAELLEGAREAPQGTLDDIGTATPAELRDDIDLLIAELESYSESEQKEFGEGE